MKKAAIFTNIKKDADYLYTDKIINFLTNEGCTNYPDEQYCKYKNLIYENKLNECDFAIVVGGDGTILRAAVKCCDYSIPIIGINIGRIGFLADIKLKNYENDLKCVLKGDFDTEHRMMLEIFHDNKCIGSALNDVVFKHMHSRGVGEFRVFAGGQHLADYSSDGVLVASPTGSTAYSLSVGGPIVDPTSELFIVQPICPHSFHSRSIILKPTEEIKIRYNVSSTQIYIDGNDAVGLKGEMVIKKSSKTVSFIKLDKHNFYKILYDKIK